MKKFKLLLPLFVSTLLVSCGTGGTPAPKTYTITWKNYDNTVLKVDDKVEEGKMPSYTGATPTKPSTEQYSYTFKGWTPTVVPATADASYVAEFNQTVNKYTVTWKNYDNSVLATESYDYGATPTYKGADPIKPSTESMDYTFKGWSPAISKVTKAATYTAQFEPASKDFTVTWKNYDNSILKTENYSYGQTPSYKGSDPVKPSTEKFNYIFTGWSPEITEVTENATYVAQFEENIKKFTVTWVNYNDFPLEIDEDVPYGTIPSYNGLIDPIRPDHEGTGYTFIGWTPEIKAVTADITYKAVFEPHKVYYTVTWVNYDDTPLEVDENLEYGVTPEYNGTTPTKPATAANTFTFKGWTPAVGPVTGNTTYKAEFTSSTNSYDITWLNYDGSQLAKTKCEYGKKPNYSGPTPTKKGATFIGWDPTLKTTTDDATYKAVFEVNYTLINQVVVDNQYAKVTLNKFDDDNILGMLKLYYTVENKTSSSITVDAEGMYYNNFKAPLGISMYTSVSANATVSKDSFVLDVLEDFGGSIDKFELTITIDVNYSEVSSTDVTIYPTGLTESDIVTPLRRTTPNEKVVSSGDAEVVFLDHEITLLDSFQMNFYFKNSLNKTVEFQYENAKVNGISMSSLLNDLIELKTDRAGYGNLSFTEYALSNKGITVIESIDLDIYYCNPGFTVANKVSLAHLSYVNNSGTWTMTVTPAN